MSLRPVDHPTPARVRLNSLTGLRYFAALAVVLLHTVGNRTLSDPLVRIPGAGRIVELGYLGVTFFFMLSGFVLAWGDDPQDTKRRFYRRRFARVYPLHLATALAAIAAAVITGGAIGVVPAVTTLFLVQAWVPDSSVYFGLNGVAWSLSCEMFFYALYPFIMPRIRRLRSRGRWSVAGALLAAMALFAVLVKTVPSWHGVDRYLWVFPVFNIGLFVIGMIMATAVREGFRIRGGAATGAAAVVAALAIIVAASGTNPLSRPLATVVLAPAIAVLLVSMSGRDLSQRSSFLSSAPMVRLGEWSFALYLIHPLLRGVFLQAHLRSLGGVKGIVVEIVFILLATALAAAAYIIYERPIERWLRPKARSRVNHSDDPRPATATIPEMSVATD